MKRADIIKKISAAEKELEAIVQKRKELRESISAYNMILEMSDNGQLDIFDEPAKTPTARR